MLYKKTVTSAKPFQEINAKKERDSDFLLLWQASPLGDNGVFESC